MDDKKLKRALTVQSFCPLFFLITLKYLPYFRLIWRMLIQLMKGNFSVLCRALRHPCAGICCLLVISAMWIIATILIMVGFCRLWDEGFDSEGEITESVVEKRDSGIMFLMTVLVPLLADNVRGLCDIVYYLTLLWLVFKLVLKGNLFYQNPLLMLIDYHIYEFKIKNPPNGANKDMVYIGITRKDTINDNKCIRKKMITDRIFLLKCE